MSNLESIVNSNKVNQNGGVTSQSALGKDDFLRLMMIQMRYQDPLNPMDNQAMLSQMAQFSSLEQMSNLNNNLSTKNSNESFMDATRLLGKEVQVTDPLNPQSALILSKVKSINHGKDGPVLTLENGQTTTIEQIVKVTEPTSQQQG